ncbi:MAG TPA: DNA polymerase III subunit delta [Gemmatimonadales bacterium]|nr:DNA polymerase III subunit delta [Gemmatimonadales bacterium]
MPSQTLDAFLRAVRRGDLAPVYYLHGAEDRLKDEAVRAVLDRALDPGLRDFNFDQRTAADLDPEAVYTLCNTPPMLADRRVVLIRGVEAWRRRTKARATLLACLERPAPDALVLLVQGAGEEEDKELAARAVSIACEPLPPDRATKWALHRAAQLGATLEPEAADHLVRVVGADLGALDAEIAKLAAAAGSDPVGTDRVAALVGVRHGETIFDWRDAVVGDDPARAARLLGPVLSQSGVNGVRLITLLGTTLLGVGVTRAAWDRGVRGSRLEDAAFKLLLRVRAALPGYREEARRWAGWAPRWPVARVRTALAELRAADTALKSTTLSDERGVILDAVFRIAGARGAA